MERESFEASNYLKGNAFIIQCTVTVTEYPYVPGNKLARPITVSPCKLRQQLGYLLASGLGADITFQVGTKTFRAHRCILAASSPVFRAQLFCPLKEKDMISDDATEKQHFLGSREESCWMHQHLLVAADRFRLDRLRSTCEFLLCRDLDVDNVSAALVLAIQHNCRQLKIACLKYMASKKILTAVMATDRSQILANSCPELVERMNASCQAKRRNDSLLNVIILSLCVLWIVGMYFRLPQGIN